MRPDNALFFMQSQVINLSINSEMPKPVVFFIQRCLLLGLMLPFLVSNGDVKDYFLIVIERLINTISLGQTDDMIKAAISISSHILSFMFFTIQNPKWFIL